MGLRRIRELLPSVGTVLVGFECNQCGRRGDTESHDDSANFHVFDASGSYHNSYPGDLTSLEWVLCSDCLKALVAGFLSPPNESVAIGVQSYEAFHTEREEIVIVDCGWVYRPGENPQMAWDGEREAEYRADHKVWQDKWDALEAEERPWPSKCLYRHFKGGPYEIIDTQEYDIETNEPLVIYRSVAAPAAWDAPRVFARPLSMWADHIERDGYSGPRFTFIEGVRELDS